MKRVTRRGTANRLPAQSWCPLSMLLPVLMGFIIVFNPASANAETLTGRINYIHPNSTQSGLRTDRPVANATLRVFYAPVPPPAPPGMRPPPDAWLPYSTHSRYRTDSSGNFSINVASPLRFPDPTWSDPFRTRPEYPVQYRIEVVAENDVAVVLWADDPARPYSQFTFKKTAYRSDNVLNLSTQMDIEPGYFNVADKIRYAREYADIHRDSRETDTIPKATIAIHRDLPGDDPNTWYDPVSRRVHIGKDRFFEDAVIVHEYAHFLEHHIGSFWIQASSHYGCAAMVVGTAGYLNSPELAWMEGFASYFAGRVVAHNPGEFSDIRVGTFSDWEMETPQCLGNDWDPTGDTNIHGQVITPDMLEKLVAGVLWDLGDEVDVAHGDAVEFMDDQIFQIFDRELDYDSTNTYPTLKRFHEAWTKRGLDGPGLDQIISAVDDDAGTGDIWWGRDATEHHVRTALERSVPLVLNLDGTVDVFVRRSDNQWWHRGQDAGNGTFGGWTHFVSGAWTSPVILPPSRITGGTKAWSGLMRNPWGYVAGVYLGAGSLTPSVVASKGIKTIHAPAVFPGNSLRQEAFAVAVDGNGVLSCVAGDPTLTSLSTPVTKELSAWFTSGANVAYGFKKYSNGVWHPSIEVYARWLNNRAYRTVQIRSGCQFGEWQEVGNGVEISSIPVGIIANGSSYVFALLDENLGWTREPASGGFNNAEWNRVSNLVSPATGKYSSVPAVLVRGDVIEVFIRNINGVIERVSQSTPGGGFSAEMVPGQNGRTWSSAPAAIYDGNGTLHVFAIDGDLLWRTQRSAGGPFSPWESMGTPGGPDLTF